MRLLISTKISPVCDLKTGGELVGPFITLNELVNIYKDEADLKKYYNECSNNRLNKEHTKDIKYIMSHNDLHPQNIIVDNNYNIKAILDWEFSGYCSIYYEYKRRLYKNDSPYFNYMFKDYENNEILEKVENIENILFDL